MQKRTRDLEVSIDAMRAEVNYLQAGVTLPEA